MQGFKYIETISVRKVNIKYNAIVVVKSDALAAEQNPWEESYRYPSLDAKSSKLFNNCGSSSTISNFINTN